MRIFEVLIGILNERRERMGKEKLIFEEAMNGVSRI